MNKHLMKFEMNLVTLSEFKRQWSVARILSLILVTVAFYTRCWSSRFHIPGASSLTDDRMSTPMTQSYAQPSMGKASFAYSTL